MLTDAAPTLRLRGLVTEADLGLADREFPGILAFYRRLGPDGPGTFLDLVVAFGAFGEPSGPAPRAAPPRAGSTA